MQKLSMVTNLGVTAAVAGLFGVIFVRLNTYVDVIMKRCLKTNRLRGTGSTSGGVVIFDIFYYSMVTTIVLLMNKFFPRVCGAASRVGSLTADFVTMSTVVVPFYTFARSSCFALHSNNGALIAFLFSSMFA